MINKQQVRCKRLLLGHTSYGNGELDLDMLQDGVY